MKICYLANVQSIHTQRWATHFGERGYRIAVVSFQPGEMEGVSVFSPPPRVSWHRVNILLNVWRVRRLVEEIDPDIVHAHYATSYGFVGALTGRKPLIISAWGSDVLIMPKKSFVYRKMVRFAMKRADLITSVAQHMTDTLVEKGYARAAQIITFPFGIDTNVFNLGCRKAMHAMNSWVVVSTRNLEQGYDVDMFIRAIPKILQAFPEAWFVVVGDGPLRKELEELAATLGVRDRLEFRGKIPHRAMPEILGLADVYVTTSPSDGTSVSLNEAMACGALPVATDIPANSAWIEHGKNGFLFPCRDVNQLSTSVIEALRKPEWRTSTMQVNWEIVSRQASWSTSMAEMERHYRRLTGRGRQVP